MGLKEDNMFRLLLVVATFLIVYGQYILNATPIEKNKKIKAPESGTYIGLYMSSQGTLSDIDNFKERSSKKAAIYYRHNWWESSLSNPQHGPFDAKKLAEEKEVVWSMAWALPTDRGKTKTKEYAEKIIKGDYDNYIYNMAREVREYGYAIMITPFIEFDNSKWSLEPELYKKFHCHVVDIFNEIGVTNVTWFMYSGCDVNSKGKNSPQMYYPGDNYVDWVGSSFYYKDDGSSWKEARHDTWRDFFSNKNSPSKPMIAPEYGPYGEKGTRGVILGENLNKISNNDFTNLHALTLIGFDWNWNENYCSLSNEEYQKWRDAVKNNPLFISDVQYMDDNTPPSQINDLKAIGGDRSVELTWTASGDDGNKGKAKYYIIKYSEKIPIEAIKPSIGGNKKSDDSTDSNFIYWSACQKIDENIPAPAEGGSKQKATISGLKKGVTYYFGIVAVDDVNYTSPLSNIVKVSTQGEDLDPEVELISPKGGEAISGYTDIIFKAVDKNSQTQNELEIIISYSLDGGNTWSEIKKDTLDKFKKETNYYTYLWNTQKQIMQKKVKTVRIKIEAIDSPDYYHSNSSENIIVNNINLSSLYGFEDDKEGFRDLKNAGLKYEVDTAIKKVGNGSLRIGPVAISSGGYAGIIKEGEELKEKFRNGEEISFFIKSDKDIYLMIGVSEESSYRYEKLYPVVGNSCWRKIDAKFSDFKLAEGEDVRLDLEKVVALYLYAYNATGKSINVNFWVDHICIKKEGMEVISPKDGEAWNASLRTGGIIKWKVMDSQMYTMIYYKKEKESEWKKVEGSFSNEGSYDKLNTKEINNGKYLDDGWYLVKIVAEKNNDPFSILEKIVRFEIRNKDDLPPEYKIRLVPVSWNVNAVFIYIEVSERMIEIPKLIIGKTEYKDLKESKDTNRNIVYYKEYGLGEGFDGDVVIKVEGKDVVSNEGKIERTFGINYESFSIVNDKDIDLSSSDKKVRLIIKPNSFNAVKNKSISSSATNDNQGSIHIISKMPEGFNSNLKSQASESNNVEFLSVGLLYDIIKSENIDLKKEEKIKMHMNYDEENKIKDIEDKLAIYYFDDRLYRWKFQDRLINLAENKVISHIDKFGTYGVFADTRAPEVKILKNISKFTSKPIIVAQILDYGSGVNTSKVEMKIDGHKVDTSFESSILTYTATKEFRGGNHQIEIMAPDNVYNKTTLVDSFDIQGTFEFGRLFNCKNPFSERTIIRVELKKQIPFVNIKIFDISGELVKEFPEVINTGSSQAVYIYDKEWDGKNGAGQEVASGVYLVLVTAKDEGQTISRIFKMARARE